MRLPPLQKRVTLDYDCDISDITNDDSQESIEVSYGSSVGSLPRPERRGYVFTGWFIEEDQYFQSTIWHIDSETATLTAKWEITTFYVDYKTHDNQPLAKVKYNYLGEILEGILFENFRMKLRHAVYGI